MFRYFLFVSFLLLSAGHCVAQLPQLRHYTVNDGMPSNNVYSTFQDSKGFMWICTDWGISRFDGRHFENITSNDGLPDNEVFFIREDPWHRYWLFCYNKAPGYIYKDKVYTALNDPLCRLIKEKGMKYGNFHENGKNEFCLVGPRNYILQEHSIIVDSSRPEFTLAAYQFSWKGKAYFVDEHKLCRKDGAVWVPLSHIEQGAFRVCFFLNGHIYITVNSEKVTRSGKKTLFYDIDLNGDRPVIKERNRPYSIFFFAKGKNGAIWCCTDNGVYAYDPDRPDRDELVALPGVVVYSCFVDAQNRCWFATNKGMYLQPSDTTWTYNRSSGLTADEVRAVCYMPGGELLAGYDNGIIDILSGGKIRSVRITEKRYWNRVMYMLPLNKDIFFAGTDLGLYQVDRTTGKHTWQNIYSQKAGAIRDSILLLGIHGGSDGGSVIYDIASGQTRLLPLSTATNLVIATAIDAEHTYWLGTLEGLYYIRHGKLKKLEGDTTIAHSRITSLTIFKKNKLIVSTLSNGIFIIDGARIHRIDKSKGLISNICKKAYVDEKDRIWVNTDKGLERITLLPDFSPVVYHLSSADGVQNFMINDLALGNGKVYLATSKGIVVISQDQTSGSMPYRVYILSVSLKDSMINYPERIVLGYKQNNVQITYTAISYTEGGDVTYKYLLQGASTDTVRTEAGSLNLGALSPGNYKLMVWGAGKNNNWNKIPAVLYITVRPPFWLELWFIAGVACILLAAVILTYKKRVSRVRKKEKERAGRKRVIAELEMQALRAQINPHFMFNALNAIQNFYNQNDELSANYYMTSFARLIRQTLTFSKEHWIMISDEMSMLKTYIELEQMRFRNAFTYEINAAPELMEAKIPTMLLQTYTENAINHGLRHLEGQKGRLIITCLRQDNAIICRIDDNGVGFEKARLLDSRPGDYKSMGLKITANRIETVNELYGILITTRIIDKSVLDKNMQGTIIELTIHNTPGL